MDRRRVLFVAGAGRSGTSTLAVLLQRLGMHVPQPEVAADESNPRGFGEPRWLVDFHDALLEEAAVTVSDSRPSAWFETGRIATREPDRSRAASWLSEHLDQADELVVKDPRLAWFLGLWRVAAIRSQATPVFATMLREPAEVVGSKQRYYRNRLGAAHLAASWLNMLLHTERATRTSVADGGRVFVRYSDLLDDWVPVLRSVGEQLQLRHVLAADHVQIREAHRFVDPSLRRVTIDLTELGLPHRLRELVSETWLALSAMAEPQADTDPARQRVDELREAYVELYEEAEAISKSSVVAAHTRGRRAADAAREAGAVTDRLRSRVPPAVRRAVRAAMGKPV